MLRALLEAEASGLTRKQLAHVTGLGVLEVDYALRALDPLLSGEGAEGPIRLYHASLRDFLLEDPDHLIQ